MSVLLKLLSSDNFIPVNRTLIKNFGLSEAVILGELCSEYNYWESEDKLEDDMFYCSASKLENKTGLSEYQQRKALQNLKDTGIIEVKLKGLPATKFFKINTDKLLDFLQTSSEKTKELDVKKLQSSNIINNKKINNKSLSKDKDNTKNFEFGKTVEHKKSLYDRCVSQINSFTENREIKELLFDFLNSLSEMKKLRGENQFVGILKKLKDYGDTDEKQIKIIQYTIEHGYSTFYEYKEFTKKSNVSSDIGKHAKRLTAEEKQRAREAIANGTAEKY